MFWILTSNKNIAVCVYSVHCTLFKKGLGTIIYNIYGQWSLVTTYEIFFITTNFMNW